MTKFILETFVLICVIQATLSVGCPNGCKADECCVSFFSAIASKRQLKISDLKSKFINPINTELKVHMCRKIKRKGERCLVNNRSGEWCDCEAGTTCVAHGKSGLDRFFGSCNKA
ncbi:hypothetical protein LOTGIDRAFT_171338 [Lottia gigantea]|uniref:Prokineticin domain-containing protein n=1 Tax=Lottia gigantea TaxID=225164 RepID=V4AHK6_LOTGI|nr:hypothetical protein LOTGIDRAFT_171338 [Lottia gigantea]ESP03544.1 hypothetical protein LOTGIDRAFT_171338 [Lottia gigantea]